jgi:hypothetical protein
MTRFHTADGGSVSRGIMAATVQPPMQTIGHDSCGWQIQTAKSEIEP